MRCLQPKEIFVKARPTPGFISLERSKQWYLVPCGHCYACMTNRRNEWDLRLRVEALNSLTSYFITLTLDDDHVGDFMVQKSHVQDFIRSLRHVYPNTSFRYYAIGEYGSLGRPHYHILLFLSGEIINMVAALYSNWDKGFVDIDEVNDATIHYVTKWHINPKFSEGKEVHGFSLMSKGIGRALLDNLTLENIKPYFSLNRSSLPVSRYYRKKIGFVVEEQEDLIDYLVRKYKLRDYSQAVRKHADLIRFQQTKLNLNRHKLD